MGAVSGLPRQYSLLREEKNRESDPFLGDRQSILADSVPLNRSDRCELLGRIKDGASAQPVNLVVEKTRPTRAN